MHYLKKMITIKILNLKRKITPAACTIMDFERVPLHGIDWSPVNSQGKGIVISCGGRSKFVTQVESLSKWPSTGSKLSARAKK